MSRLLLLAIAGLLTSPGAPAAADLDLGELAGDWLRVEPQPENDRARERAVDGALDDLSWVMRTVARPILRRSTTPPDRYSFLVGERYPFGIAIGNSRREPRPLMLDGRERPFTDDDEQGVAHDVRLEDAIETRWRTDKAHGLTRFRLSPDRRMLIVESLLQITAMSNVDAISFTTHFVRPVRPVRPVGPVRPDAAR